MEFEQARRKFRKMYLSLIRKYHNGASVQRKDDLKQLGDIAIWEALESFDPAAGAKLSTHVYNRIRYKFMKSRGEDIGVSIKKYERMKERDCLPKMVCDEELAAKDSGSRCDSDALIVLSEIKGKCDRCERALLRGVLEGEDVEDICRAIGIKRRQGYYILSKVRSKAQEVMAA